MSIEIPQDPHQHSLQTNAPAVEHPKGNVEDAEVIWITGASSGIGLALAQQYAGHNRVLILSGRNGQKLEEICTELNTKHTTTCAIPLVFDVLNSDESKIRESLEHISPKIDKVIVNAGNCEYVNMDAPDWGMFDRMIDTNFIGAINTIKAAFPLLKAAAKRHEEAPLANKKPHIIGVSSMVVHAPFTQAQAYGASKAAFSYFLSSLKLDLQSTNIDVTDVQPGFVKTPLTDKNNFPMPFLLTSEQAASIIYEKVDKRPHTLIFPKRLKWLLGIYHLTPNLWFKLMTPKPPTGNAQTIN